MIWLRYAPYVAMAASLAAFLWWVDHRAYNRGEAACEARHAAATADLNQRLRESQEQHRQAALRFLQNESATDELVRGLSNEAATDPDAGRFCMGAGSVQRLNAVR